MKRARDGLIGFVILALLVVAVARLLSSNAPVPRDRPMALGDIEVPASGVIRWSPDATKLALVVSGELVIVGVAEGRELARRGTNVADVAWMPDGGRVVLVEGPIATGQIAAVATTGRVAGTTTLRPSIPFGLGRGLGIDGTGTDAAAIATRREAIGGATRHDLALVNLQTGATKVFVTDDREESNPMFVDEEIVVYASATTNELRLQALDVTTEEVQNLGVIHDGPFGVLATGEVVVGHRAAQGAYRLDAVDLAGESRVLGVVRAGRRVVAIDRFGTRVLVRKLGADAGRRLAIEAL